MKIGIFGCGNMGEALARGFSKTGVELYLYTPSKIKAKLLSEELGGVFVDLINEMPKDLDWYVLGFKPQSLNDFNFSFSKDSKILSILAGVETKKIEKKFDTSFVARLMPNTPSRIGEGANLFYSSFDASPLKECLKELGKLFELESEEKLDLLTSFSGSGPALVFEFARLFEKHLKMIAGEDSYSRELIAQTFLGSSKLMMESLKSGKSFEVLRDEVTSKKGVTHEALEILSNNGFDNIMGGAFNAAYKRTLELKKGI